MKILYISYYYPPNNEIASLRSMYQVKYLRQLGADVSVVCFDSSTPEKIYSNQTENDHYVSSTPTLSSLKEKFISKSRQSKKDVCKTNQENKITQKIKNFLRKAIDSSLIEAIAEIYRLLHHTIFMIKAFFKSHNICKCSKYDFVYTSYGPESTILIGYLIQKLFNVSLVTEFRDRWLNHPYNFEQKNYLHKKLILYLENLIASSSSVLIGVSPGMISELKQDHPSADLQLVCNGYDEPLKLENESYDLDISLDKLTLVYTGSIYVGRQDLELIFKALYEINWPVEFIYCGKSYDYVEYLTKKHQIESKVLNLGFQPNHVSRMLQKESDVLLLLGWNDPLDKGVLTGKVFEYLAARKPILFCGYPDGDVNDLITTTNSGKTCVTVTDVANFIESVRNNSSNFTFSNIDDYTRFNQTKNLFNILKNHISQ